MKIVVAFYNKKKELMCLQIPIMCTAPNRYFYDINKILQKYSSCKPF